MSDNAGTAEQQMGTGLRVVLIITGAALCALGALSLFVTARFFIGENPAAGDNAIYQIQTFRDTIYLVLWAIVALCFVITGISLVRAAVQKRMYDVVPGPTLYVLGVSLVIIGMFLATVGGLLPAALMGAVGFALMWLEYRSTFI